MEEMDSPATSSVSGSVKCSPVKQVQSNSEERKRLLEDVFEVANKKIKITNSSLGLSLLQAYDEDIQEDYESSDGEDTISEKENTENSSIIHVKSYENSVIDEILDKDVESESIIEDNLSFYVIEEETNQTVSLNETESPSQNCSILDSDDKLIEVHIYSEEVPNEKDVSNTVSDVTVEVHDTEKKLQKHDSKQVTFINTVLSEVEETKPVKKTSDEIKKEDLREVKGAVKVQNSRLPDEMHTSNERLSADVEKPPCDVSSQPLVALNAPEIEWVTLKSQNGVTENMKLSSETENKNTVRADYNFCIFGKNEYDSCGSDTDRSDSKPVKKVKLNRSKFVRSADESSADMKFLPVKIASPSLKDSPTAVMKTSVDTSDSALSDNVISSASNINVSNNLTNLTLDSKSNVVVEKEENMLPHEIKENTVSSQLENVNSIFSVEISSSFVTHQKNDECPVFEECEIDHLKNDVCNECVTSHPTDNPKTVSLEEPSNESSVKMKEEVINRMEVEESRVIEVISSHNKENIEGGMIANEKENVNKEEVMFESTNVLPCHEEPSENDVNPENVMESNVEIKSGILKENETKNLSTKLISDDNVQKDSEKSQLEEAGKKITEILSNDDEKLELKNTAESGNISSDEEIFKDAMETVENDEQKKNIVKNNEETNIVSQGSSEKDNLTDEKQELVLDIFVNDKMDVADLNEENKVDVKKTEDKTETVLKENYSMVESLVEDTKTLAEKTDDLTNTDDLENNEKMETAVEENLDEDTMKEIGKKTMFLEEMEEMEPLFLEESSPSSLNSIEESKKESSANVESTDEQILPSAEKPTEKTAISVEKVMRKPLTISDENNEMDETIAEPKGKIETAVAERTEAVVEQSECEPAAIIHDTPTDTKSTDEPSKLENALTGKKSSHVLAKKVEISSTTAEESETNKCKENIKLHLSVQGNRVSIKKTKSTSSPELSTPEQPRVKRQYKKRIKVVPDETVLQNDGKSYKLRTRTKKGVEKDESVGERNNSDTETVLQKSSGSAKKLSNNSFTAPLTVEIDRAPEKSSKVTGKVQPIKLKISKSPSVTIECTSKCSPVTIEKIGNTEKADVSKKIVGMLEEARKKDASSSNYIEQASSAWSGPDLQRVERLLKESNITITPVMSSRDASPQPSNSILKPMLTAAKEKSTQKVTSTSPPSTAAPVRPISNENTETDSADTQQSSRNLNVIIKPLDLEEQMQCWKIARPNSSMDITPIPTAGNKQVDVKSEIRKKIASAERRKLEMIDSDIEIPLEVKPKSGKSLPDLLPISVTSSTENSPQTSVTSSAESTPQMTIPDTTATLDTVPSSVTMATTTTTSTTLAISETPPAPPCVTSEVQAEETPSTLQNTITPVFPIIPFPSFPKKRGRPTKAMVAAREAYKQSQEAFEQYRQQSRAGMQEGQQAAGENGEMSHFMVPLFDMTESPDGSPMKSKRGRKPKNEKMERPEGANISGLEPLIMDPAREQEEIKRMEEDRIKREIERDRKNELRRLKAKERSDLVKAKRLRQKMKAEERQKRVQEQKRLLQEEKKKLEEEIKNLPTGFDDARMSIENGGQVQNLSFGMDEDSSSTIIDMGQRMKKSRMEVTDLDSKDLTVDQIAEYQWPIQGGELYMIQEQISNFLGVKSFKRKYPDIKRRPVDSEERAYLVDSGLVSETMCDLGITAVCSAEVLDIMCSDFADKYEELRKYMREKQMKELSFKQRAWANGLGYKLLMADGSKQDLKKRAMESASNWNSALNKSRGEDRRCAMDLQTFIVHYPKTKAQQMTIPTPKIGSFPVSILPGQFCDFYKEYTSTELRYFPVNSVLYGPLKHLGGATGADGSQTDSDDTSSSDESSSTTSDGTQGTEDTLEDIDKDMSLDEPSHLEKSHEAGTPLKDDKEISRNELLNGMRETLSEDENCKLLCKICLGDHTRNKENAAEVLISCSQCSSKSHPSCLDLSLNMVPHIKSYNWQCPDCKSCARCKENADEDKMLFCDICDRGYHIYCVGLKKVPSGSWQCQECASVENNINRSMVTMQNGMNQEAVVTVKMES